MSERDRIEQALTFDTGCEPSAQEIIDALNRAGYQITPQAGDVPIGWYRDPNTVVLNSNNPMAGTDLNNMALYTAPPRPAPKCDGNHAAPACADPECWQRPSPVAPVWQPVMRELVEAMHRYEMDVDDEPPYEHRQIMDKAHKLLSALPPDSPGAEEE